MRFWQTFSEIRVPMLMEPDVTRIHLLTLSDEEALESALAGAAQPNFETRAMGAAKWSEAETWLEQQLARQDVAPLTHMCPANGPLTPTSILHRATAVTCVGCQAPDQVLGATHAMLTRRHSYQSKSWS